MSSYISKKFDNLNCKIFQTREEMGDSAAFEAAEYISHLLEQQHEVRIVFAAAPSQNEFLSALIMNNNIDWKKIIAFHMDEYIGLPAGMPQSFGKFLDEKIFKKIPLKAVHYIQGNADNIDAECTRYANLLVENKIDIVFLGVGENGHIAFNDPDVADFEDTQVVKKVFLDEICRQQQVNDGCFNDISEVPQSALTLTIPILCSAKRMFCIVPGINKNKAIIQMLMKDISTNCPASILRKHQAVNLYLDVDSSQGVIV